MPVKASLGPCMTKTDPTGAASAPVTHVVERRQIAEAAVLPARGERTRDLIAKVAGGGERTAQDVITVHDHDPALFERVIQGQVAANRAASQVRRAKRDASLPPAPPLPDGPFEL